MWRVLIAHTRKVETYTIMKKWIATLTMWTSVKVAALRDPPI